MEVEIDAENSHRSLLHYFQSVFNDHFLNNDQYISWCDGLLKQVLLYMPIVGGAYKKIWVRDQVHAQAPDRSDFDYFKIWPIWSVSMLLSHT